MSLFQRIDRVEFALKIFRSASIIEKSLKKLSNCFRDYSPDNFFHSGKGGCHFRRSAQGKLGLCRTSFAH